jgi:alcohol dehydrogenase class IV
MARVVKPGATDGQEFVDWIVALSHSIGIPVSLGALGVKPDDLAPLVAVAIKDGCHPLNPKPVTEKDFYAIYQDAF